MTTYFGETGLTSTSANYIANMAKEYYRHIEAEINSVSAFSVDVSIIGDKGSSQISVGNSLKDFNALGDKLNKIAECKSLIAYLREAIKERDRLYTEASNYHDWEARAHNPQPVRAAYLTEEQLKGQWTIAELNRYLSLEAKCATFGKYIHENGYFNRMRDSYHETLNALISIQGLGRDTIITKNTPTVSGEELDNVFFKLQDEYRSAQAELNGIKHKLEEALEKDKMEKDNAYNKANAEYMKNVHEIVEREAAYSQALLAELQKMKIVIPNHLLNIYNEISNLKNSK